MGKPIFPNIKCLIVCPIYRQAHDCSVQAGSLGMGRVCSVHGEQTLSRLCGEDAHSVKFQNDSV